ncbi:MAG TPA: Gfo/Idh/MocA family oxidoreductase [Chloroflexia bacterium]|jgi:predicted dehydrogenase
MQKTKLRWGVLGTARIADANVAGIRKSKNGELVAIASRDIEKARAWAQERDVPHYFGSYDEMLASDLIDAVYVPLPNALHAEWSIRAAEHHKHVLCEKPAATNPQDVERMIAAAQENGVKIMEAFMFRFHPQTERVRQLVADQAIGETRIIRATFDFYLRRPHDVRWSKDLGGGALMDVGCYCVNIATLLAGMPPHRVTASAVWADTGVDMSLVGTLEFPNGVLALIDCSFNVGRTMQQWVEISGTDGLIKVAEPFRIREEDTAIVIDRCEATSPIESITIEGAHEYHLMVEHFADAVLSNTELSYTLGESLANMQTMGALLESARTGRRVEVNT